MKLADKDLQIMLAGEYVIGTLSGQARRRFETLLKTRPDLQAAVRDWEQKLSPLALDVKPVSPPPGLWAKIANEINSETLRPKKRQKINVWPWLALAASLTTVTLAGLFAANLSDQQRPLYVAVLGGGANPAWVMTLAHRGRVLDVSAVHPVPSKGHSYQLWMLPGKGQAPRSLGLLPVRADSTIQVRIPPTLHLASAQGLAVSLEPPKGSPLAGPSGPIVYQATWLPIVRSS